jgi:hypothetical protein
MPDDPTYLDEARTTQGPSRLLRALKRTRAPLTAFGMTNFCVTVVFYLRFWFTQPSRQGWLGLIQISSTLTVKML